MVVAADKEEQTVLEEMKKRIDRLVFAIQRDVKDGDFRFELTTDLALVRRKLDKRSENDGRTDN